MRRDRRRHRLVPGSPVREVTDPEHERRYAVVAGPLLAGRAVPIGSDSDDPSPEGRVLRRVEQGLQGAAGSRDQDDQAGGQQVLRLGKGAG